MKTIEMTAMVGPDRKIVVQLPPDIRPGKHSLVVVIEETPAAAVRAALADWPLHDVGPWPADLSLRREDLYDDSAR